MTHDNHKQELERMLKETIGELATLGIHNPDNPDDWIATPPPDSGESDVIDLADSAEDWGEKAATLALIETRHNNIKRALRKLTEDTYGTCEICGEPIEPERLTVSPEARTCILHREDESTLPL